MARDGKRTGAYRSFRSGVLLIFCSCGPPDELRLVLRLVMSQKMSPRRQPSCCFAAADSARVIRSHSPSDSGTGTGRLVDAQIGGQEAVDVLRQPGHDELCIPPMRADR